MKRRTLNLDPLTIQTGTDNVHEVEFGQVYYLNYYGINVFFCVSRTDTRRVCVFELAKKRIRHENKTVDILCNNYKPTSAPKIVDKEVNCCSKSDFWVDTESGKIYVPITRDNIIYKEVIKKGIEQFPKTGTFEAVYLKEEQENGLLNYYWE